MKNAYPIKKYEDPIIKAAMVKIRCKMHITQKNEHCILKNNAT